MDNLKCLLIFLVVLGHMLELFKKDIPAQKLLYLVIYSFHMPMFAFVSGVFARYNPDKIKSNMIYPYIVFQTLYLVFMNQVMEKDADMQYTTPYWLLWYLFAIIVWNLILPLVQSQSRRKKAVMLFAALAASVLIGFDEKAGYYLSASRIVEFFPYFLMGVYYRDMKAGVKDSAKFWARNHPGIAGWAMKNRRWKFLGMGAVASLTVLFILFLAGHVDEINSVWLYGSYSYEKGDYSYRFRLLSIGGAMLWIAFFTLCIPVRRFRFLSYIGANTMPVYLLHGFVIKLLSKVKFFQYVEHDIAAAVILSGLLIAALSFKPLVAFLTPLFRWDRADYEGLTARLRPRGKRMNG